MGGGEYLNQRYEQQTAQVQTAYTELVGLPKGKMDGIDQAYVWARTFTPSWMMGLIFLAGLLTLLPFILKKFGINLRLTVEKKEKGDG